MCCYGIREENMGLLSQKFHQYYNKLSYSQAKLFQNVKKVLQTLSLNSRLVCLSASLSSTLLKQLKYYEIDQYFDDIVGLDDAFARSKTQVAIDFMKEKQIDPNHCLLIGDSLHDAEVANAIHVPCILVSTGHTSKKRLSESNCKIIDDLIEIL